jgi:hypothetical protein
MSSPAVHHAAELSRLASGSRQAAGLACERHESCGAVRQCTMWGRE